MVRHGQYNEKGTSDSEHTLTELGSKQAALTGSRLRDLLQSPQYKKYPLKYMYSSTMTRANQTALISAGAMGISADFIINSDLIREGSVCKPVPEHSTWKPSEEEVSFEKYIVIK